MYKKIHPLPPATPICKNLNIHHKKNLNENDGEFNFRIGTVLVHFSKRITWAPALPLSKIFNIYHRKKNGYENYVKFDFRMGTVLVIFSFF